MKKLILLSLISVLFICCNKINPSEDKDDPIETAECIRTKNMAKYYHDTTEMVEKGMYKTALNRFIWFHENALKYDSDISGVRLSFALGDWKRFADDYPSAMKALIEIRDRDTKKALENGNPQLFKDVMAINRALDRDPNTLFRTLTGKKRELKGNLKTVDLFKTLMHKNPEASKQCWVYAKKPLFDAKRYDIIKHYIGNPVNEYNNLRSELKEAIDGTQGDEELNEFCKTSFAEECIQVIQYSLAVNDLKSAKEIQKKALTVVKDDRLNDAIPN